MQFVVQLILIKANSLYVWPQKSVGIDITLNNTVVVATAATFQNRLWVTSCGLCHYACFTWRMERWNNHGGCWVTGDKRLRRGGRDKCSLRSCDDQTRFTERTGQKQRNYHTWQRRLQVALHWQFVTVDIVQSKSVFRETFVYYTLNCKC